MRIAVWLVIATVAFTAYLFQRDREYVAESEQMPDRFRKAEGQ